MFYSHVEVGILPVRVECQKSLPNIIFYRPVLVGLVYMFIKRSFLVVLLKVNDKSVGMVYINCN